MALTKIGRLLDKGVIKDQTNLGAEAADTDEFLLYDASADTLKAIASSNVTPGATLITGKDEITIGNVASGDFLLIYDTSAGALKKITKSAFDALQPTFSSVSPSNLLSGDGTGNHTIVVTGSDFDATATFKLKTDGGTDITMDSVTRDSASQLTGTVAKNKANLTNANEPFDIIITNGNGLSVTNANAVNIDAQPVFSTAAGSLASVANGARSGFSTTILAADPESGGDIVYTLESGTLPAGASLSSQSSGCVISGNLTAVGSNTTSNFTIRAKDAASNVTDRAFSISVLAPAYQTFTSSGTFTVPSGLTTVDVLVVAGGGGAGSVHSGGGGAGGLIYRPGFSVTPGATVTVTVGDGGTGSTGTSGHANGQDSVFGTLTAKGGGKSGTNQTPGSAGGSGGGCGYGSPSQGGPANQPTQSGESGNYGFGNPGGGPGANAPLYGTGGGGGAGAAGSAGNNGAGGASDHPIGGPGGVGKAYTISDGTTSVYYAGGGGGASGNGNEAGSTSQGGNGGGGNGVTSGVGQSGTANRGGGGGGSDDRSAPHGGGSGGKGVVIVAY